MFQRNLKVSKKVKELNNFRGHVSQCLILIFTTRTRNSELFLNTQLYKVFTKKDYITKSGAAGVKATNPISFRVDKNT